MASVRGGFLRDDAGALVVSGLGPSPYAVAVLADSPTSYWRLNETSGAVAVDEMGVNDGTYVNAPVLGASALTDHGGHAVRFVADDSNELQLPGPALSTVGTIEFWFALGAPNPLNSANVVMRDHTQGAGWIFGYDNASAWAVRVAGTTINTSLSTAAMRDGLAHHFVLSKNGANLTVYIDNVAVATSSSAPSTASTGIWHVGANGSNPNQYTNCTIDEIAIYPTALTAGQVAAHFNA